MTEESGSGTGFFLNPDLVCPTRLDPNSDSVNIRPDPKPWNCIEKNCY